MLVPRRKHPGNKRTYLLLRIFGSFSELTGEGSGIQSSPLLGEAARSDRNKNSCGSYCRQETNKDRDGGSMGRGESTEWQRLPTTATGADAPYRCEETCVPSRRRQGQQSSKAPVQSSRRSRATTSGGVEGQGGNRSHLTRWMEWSLGGPVEVSERVIKGGCTRRPGRWLRRSFDPRTTRHQGHRYITQRSLNATTLL